jgi:uncharacterized protein YwgA
MLVYLRTNKLEIEASIKDSTKMLDSIADDLAFVVKLVKSDDRYKTQELIDFAKKAKLWLAFIVHQPFAKGLKEVFSETS